MEFRYYYGTQAEQFSFIRIPRVIIMDKKFADLSVYSKVLYGLLLDRMGLSMKNGWMDKEDRVYIIYQIAEIQEDLGVSKKKAIDYLAELETFGLIEKKRRGLGLASIIYVKNFMVESTQTADVAETDIIKISKGSQSGTSEGVDSTGKIVVTEDEYAGKSSIMHEQKHEIQMNGEEKDQEVARFNEIGEVSAYTELIKENIEYDALLQEYPLETETVHGILDLICETVVCRAKDITIASNVYPAELVKSKFLKLRFDHVSYVISCMQGNTTKVKNIKKYLLAALFNAPSTMDSYYRAEVNHDMPQFAREG